MRQGQKYEPSNIKDHHKSPNILFIIVDEQHFPTAYDNEELNEWRRLNLKAQRLLSENSMSFINHYIGSTACSPSRATLFTGRYPSLHGVTQTTDAAKRPFDTDMY